MGKCSNLGGRNSEEKKCKRHKFHAKTNLHTTFSLNQTMGKCLNQRERGRIQWEGNVTNQISKWIYITNYIKIRKCSKLGRNSGGGGEFEPKGILLTEVTCCNELSEEMLAIALPPIVGISNLRCFFQSTTLVMQTGELRKRVEIRDKGYGLPREL